MPLSPVLAFLHKTEGSQNSMFPTLVLDKTYVKECMHACCLRDITGASGLSGALRCCTVYHYA